MDEICFSGDDMLATLPKCELCASRATHERLVADPNTRGFNLNEPGARWQRLCEAHAAEAGISFHCRKAGES